MDALQISGFGYMVRANALYAHFVQIFRWSDSSDFQLRRRRVSTILQKDPRKEYVFLIPF